MLTSLFEDAGPQPSPRTANLDDEAGLFRRLEPRDRQPGWIAPAAGLAVMGGIAAAALLLTHEPVALSEPTAAAGAARSDLLTTTAGPPRPMQTASLSTAVDPGAPGEGESAAGAVRSSRPMRPARKESSPATGRPVPESVTSAVDGQAPPTPQQLEVRAAPATPDGPAMAMPPTVETPLAAPAPAAPSDSAPADTPPAATSPPAAPVDPAL